MTQPEIKDPTAFITAQSGAWLAEVGKLATVRMPVLEAPPQNYRAALLLARANLDRLQEIMLQVMILRGGAERKALQCEQAAEDRWNELAAQANQTGTGARDYEGAKERYARFSVQCFPQTRTARQWRLAADMAKELSEQIRTVYFGMKDVRGELLEHLRTLVLESSLDR